MAEQLISVVVPALDAASVLGRSLESILRGLRALEHHGMAHEIVVADGGSTDETVERATALGGRVITAERGRGSQLAAGANAARGDWFLFLHADTRLGHGWADDVLHFVAEPENRGRAAVFRLALDDRAPAARRLERFVAWRCRALALPYGDQGLLIHRDLYDAVGGYPAIALMEDVAIIRRIGRRRLVFLETPALTSAARYRRAGYAPRMLRNATCLTLYFLGARPAFLARLYG